MLHDIVNRTIISVEKHTKLQEVARLMKKHNVGSVLVLENRKPIGMITDRDIIVRFLGSTQEEPGQEYRIGNAVAGDFMTRSVVSVSEKDGIFECIQKMRQAKVRRIPVVNDEGFPVGILSFGDLLAILSKEFSALSEGATIAGDTGGETLPKARTEKAA